VDDEFFMPSGIFRRSGARSGALPLLRNASTSLDVLIAVTLRHAKLKPFVVLQLRIDLLQTIHGLAYPGRRTARPWRHGSEKLRLSRESRATAMSLQSGDEERTPSELEQPRTT